MSNQPSSTVRRRAVQSEEEIKPLDEPAINQNHIPQTQPARHSSKPFTAFLVLVTCLSLPILYYTLIHEGSTSAANDGGEGIVMTPTELAQYTTDDKLYVAILGNVYDVTAGKNYYGSGQGYNVFVGKDASRAFVTGDFTGDLNDDILDFSPELYAEVVGWRDFYKKHDKYVYVGRVVGRFYTAKGQPTAVLKTAEAKAAQHRAHKVAQEEKKSTLGQIPCNVHWSRDAGGAVMCGDQYPRKVMLPNSAGVLQERCACFKENTVSAARQLYEGCDPDANRCQTSPPSE